MAAKHEQTETLKSFPFVYFTMALKLLHLIILLTNQCLCRKKIVMAPLEECDRIRKPMHLLSEEELMLYVDGLQQIRKNGKYQIMVDAHSQETEIHRGTSFFFYHTFFVWERCIKSIQFLHCILNHQMTRISK